MFRKGEKLSQIFDFREIKKCEKTIRKTWSEFREALAKGLFAFNEIDKAKEYTFLKVYDDLFHQHTGIDHKSVTIRELDGLLIGRGTVLKEKEVPDYERFIPKKKFINKDNRFSPQGIEWLYLAIGDENDIHQCAQAECRVKTGHRFGFCHFDFDDNCLDLKLVDLTIAEDISYNDLNGRLEKYEQTQLKKE